MNHLERRLERLEIADTPAGRCITINSPGWEPPSPEWVRGALDRAGVAATAADLVVILRAICEPGSPDDGRVSVGPLRR